MEKLQDWAMVLSGLAVFGSLCEEILPEGSFQKYIRMGLGMILVLALLSPVQELLFGKQEIQWEREMAYEETENMEERQREEILRLYRTELNGTMGETLEKEIPGFSGEISCVVEEEQENFGAIQRVEIQWEGEEVEPDEIYGVLQEQFGIKREQITLYGERRKKDGTGDHQEVPLPS